MSRSVSDIHPLFSDQLLAVNREESSRHVETEMMSMRCPNRNAVCGGVWKTGVVPGCVRKPEKWADYSTTSQKGNPN